MKITIVLAITLLLGACSLITQPEITFSKDSVFDGLSSEVVASVSTDEAPASIKKKLNSTDSEHYGIDISHYQGKILDMLKSNKDSLKFIICKATQGTTYVDPMFRTNWNEIHHLGFIRGAYHFFDCSQDAQKQAQHFSMMISDIKNYDIAPILDIEQGGLTSDSTPETVQKQVREFLTEVNRLTGRNPIIYSDYAFFQQYMNDQSFDKHNLWLAEYSGNATPLLPTGWKAKGYLIWQRSDRYDVHSTQSDLDVVKGSLKKIIKQ